VISEAGYFALIILVTYLVRHKHFPLITWIHLLWETKYLENLVITTRKWRYSSTVYGVSSFFLHVNTFKFNELLSSCNVIVLEKLCKIINIINIKFGLW